MTSQALRSETPNAPQDEPLVFTREELFAEHTYAEPHEVAGYKLHGGFDLAGTYISPRTLHRWPAVRNWQAALESRGWPLIDASGDLLQRGSYPNKEQQKLLLSHGYGQTLWNSLTITGVIEARGQALCEFEAPELQDVIADDVSAMATGHLCKGLLYTHGMDEGGDPDNPGIGAHDKMWFAVRDLLFGKDAWPLPEVPENISRPVEGRLFPGLPEAHEGLISLLMNVLMIEVRAEAFFSFCCAVMRDSETFKDRREAAGLAADTVERIRTDEAIHVAYLQTVVSELRSVTFRLEDGSSVRGDTLIDPVWQDMVEWHGLTQADLSAERTRDALKEDLCSSADGKTLFGKFDALAA